ncbi:family 43 glycosylhydrolase [Autumnicola psychrophila]|uniref:Family 43 glycosylhydrolase n=1 Tax=Autumnicola psychrophila TaxID=3075592 RepID=A0ABU3DVK2_9FLAO|nr:family 43 glycosylhydrolase [Zunongwangia sp. F225]MDT0687752.1 family 43 glycosylhydrolase [Zunongwangia sp. F225]
MKNNNRLIKTIYMAGRKSATALLLLVAGIAGNAWAQNPLIMDQFTADPSARVFGDRIYVYPSHDIYCSENNGRKNWFCMPDYHVFSSTDLQEWTDHGMILSQEDVPWGDPDANSMWAPDAIERNGKYYFYFPTRIKDASAGESGFSIGVAIADNPEGPFEPQQEPIKGVQGIDPNVFIDKDGQAYLYWSQGKIFGAKLKDNMLELASEPKVFEVPQKGHIEGPWVFERNGKYYLTYPHVANNTERLEYATGNNPLGPFEHQGVIMDESPNNTWTNHHSITEFRDQYLLFYHDSELSPNFDKNRSIRADSLFFTEDGLIEKVIPTHRGVGITDSSNKIQFDRYSERSEFGVSIRFVDTTDTFQGWKVVLEEPEAWVKYNSVDFASAKSKIAKFRARSSGGGMLQLMTGRKEELLSEVEIEENSKWKIYTAPVQKEVKGIQDLILKLKNGDKVEVDWLTLE